MKPVLVLWFHFIVNSDPSIHISILFFQWTKLTDLSFDTLILQESGATFLGPVFIFIPVTIAK